MDDRRAKLLSAGISAAALLVYVGVLAWIALPGFRRRTSVWEQWFRYWRWQAWWNSQPTWKQEALIVRGKGPQS